MIISFLDNGSFRIQTSGAVLITEALDGKTSNRLKADIFIKTIDKPSDFNAIHIIKGPGEYEIGGVEIRGFHPFFYFIKSEEIEMGYLGIGAVSSEAQEKLAGADVLFVNDSQPESVKLVRQFHPKVVLTGADYAKDLEKELGLKAEVLDKFTVKRKDFSGKDFKLIVLKK